MEKSNVSFRLHNHFNFTLKDAEGEVIQKAEAYNTVTVGLFRILFSNYLQGVCVQLGDGAGEPSSADTALFHAIWSRFSISGTIEQIDEMTFKCTYTRRIAASEEYVGDITEIGICNTDSPSSWWLFTHAMITDSEGNPITVHKTADATLDIEAIVYLTMSLPDYVVPVYPAKSYLVTGLLLSDHTPLSSKMYLAPQLNTGKFQLYRNAAYGLWENPSGMSSEIGSVNTDPTNGIVSIVNKEIASSILNGVYFNWLFDCNMYVAMNQILTPYTLQGFTVGVGDGSKTLFPKPIPAFVENSEIIYKNGIALTRGVDYVIDHRTVMYADASMMGMAEMIEAGTDTAEDGFYETQGIPFDMRPYYSSSACSHQFRFKKNFPVVFDLRRVAPMYGKTFNYFDLRGMTQLYYDGGSVPESWNDADYIGTAPPEPGVESTNYYYRNCLGTTIKLEYSMDNSNWTTIAEREITVDNLRENIMRVNDTNGYQYRFCPVFRFPAVTANFFRVSIDYSDATYYSSRTRAGWGFSHGYRDTFAQNGITKGMTFGQGYADPCHNFNHRLNNWCLGYERREGSDQMDYSEHLDINIKFMVPPADGDVLTMDAQVTQLYKNSDYKAYISANVQYQV